MNYIIALTATIEDASVLANFFLSAEQHLPNTVFVVFDPSPESNDTEMIALLKGCTTLPIVTADMDLSTHIKGVYVVSPQKNILLGNGFFVSHNTLAQKAMPFADAFWYSLAKYYAESVTVVSLEKSPKMSSGMLTVKQAGGMLACLSQENAESTESELSEISLFDIALPATQLPAAIAAQLPAKIPHSPQIPYNSETDFYAHYSTTHNNSWQQEDFDDLLQHLRTAVLYLNSDLSIRQFSNFIQHYLQLDDSAVGKSIEQVNTDFLSPNLKSWIKAVAENRVPMHQDIVLGNGECCDLKIIPIYHRYNNQFKGVMVSISDTTSTVRVQRILDSLSQQMQFQGAAFWKEYQKAQVASKNNTETMMTLDLQRELWNNIAQTMHEGIIAVRPNRTIAMINKAAKVITGMQPDEVVTDWLQTHRFYLLNDEQIPILANEHPLTRAFEGYYTGEEDIDLYVVPKNNDKEGIFVNIHTQSLPHNDAQKNGLLMVLRNITDRKHSEIELRDSESRQTALLYALPDSMFHINVQGECLKYMPAKGCEIEGDEFFKYKHHFFIGNHVQDILGDMGTDIMNMFVKAIQSGEVQTHAFTSQEMDWIRHYDVRLSLVNATEALVLIRDITEVISSRYVVDRYSEYYQSLIENCPTPVIWLDQNGLVMYANSKLQRLGFDPCQIINQVFYDYLAPSYRLGAQTALVNAFRDNVAIIGRYKVVSPDGRTIPVKVKASIIQFNRKRLLQVMIGISKRTKIK